MMEVQATEAWHTAHRGGIIGFLEVRGVTNQGNCIALDERKRAVETMVREKYKGYSRQDFMAAPVLAEYERYYKRFDKSYHVQLQLESIVTKGKNLPNVSPLVDSNFVAEIESLVLTAGHDVAKLQGPVCIDLSVEGDSMTQMNGQTKPIRSGDMVMRDAEGISCTIIYGQDNRSPISGATTHALYVSYAPAGVSAEVVEGHLDKVIENVRLFAPDAMCEKKLLTA